MEEMKINLGESNFQFEVFIHSKDKELDEEKEIVEGDTMWAGFAMIFVLVFYLINL